MRNEAVSQESTEGMETGPESDDIGYFPTPHRELVAAAGRLARVEQARLEKLLGLLDGRTPKPDPGGYFP
jgi:hypothetical protein